MENRAKVGALLDILFAGFLLGLLVIGLRRPFIWVLAYIYVDIFTPQRINNGMLASVQPSLIFFVASVLGWLALDHKASNKFNNCNSSYKLCKWI